MDTTTKNSLSFGCSAIASGALKTKEIGSNDYDQKKLV